ncbi:hypothetical protein [Bradyrhizobium sp. Bra78]|uniref:hypothetical protein n=1 Tax=Bradyrhizobium sp. Bra78 TaxID=2926010 RepID=UPI0021C62016|nr:hypothetical protein [Bradyrhizobium sp. Bra78]
MARKSNDPAANGVEGIAVFSENTAGIAHNRPAAKAPVITGIRRRAGGKADWLVSIKDVCTDVPIRDRKLRRYRRFCAAVSYRFGVTFDPMAQADWTIIVEAAIAAEGGMS